MSVTVLPTQAHLPAAHSLAKPSTYAAVLELAYDLAEELRQTATERERRGELPVPYLQKLRDNGLVNLMIPERFGGLGGTVSLMVQVLT